MFARAEPNWQLTFRYGPDAVALETIRPIAATTKSVRTPGLHAVPVKLDYQLEWLDSNGHVLSSTPVVIPLGTRDVLEPGNQPSPHAGGISGTGNFALRIEGPGSLANVRALRLVRTWMVWESPLGADLPAPFLAPELRWALPTSGSAIRRHSPPGPLSFSKVRDTGPDGNRLVIVVMGDGYTEAQLANGAFSNQVARFLDHFLSVSPWSTCGEAVNVYQVDLVSNESGADYEDASPSAGGTLRDTYLDAHFWSGGLERALGLSSAGVSRAFAAADSMVGAGLWDEILVFVNSTKYGGVGGAVGVASIHPESDEIQVHELGHSFAYLADEYDYGSTGTGCGESTVRNLECGHQFPQVKWDVWIKPGTPIPTPETPEYAGVVGAFEGAFYQATGIYRPMLHCKMQSLGVPFCPVCQEAHVLQFFERIRLLDAAIPPSGPVDVVTNTARLFSVAAVPVPGIGFQWWLGGEPMTGQTNPSVNLTTAELTSANLELRVEIALSTPLVRAQSIQTNVSWQLTPVDHPSLTVSVSMVTEGDAGSQELLLSATLSAPSAATVALDYASADGTATAGADYTAVSGQLVFPPGVTARTIQIPILGDLLTEPNEAFVLNFSNPQNVTLPGEPATVVIADNDHPPVVSLISPSDAAVFWQGEEVLVSAEASDSDGSIANLTWFDNGSPLFSLTAAPFTVRWTNASPGVHTLLATATDDSGRTATSAPVSLTVLEARVQYVPLIALTNAWRYDATTNDYGDAWKDIAFEDGGWTGPSNAVFYVGNLPVGGPKRTPLPLSYNGTRIRAFYFRTHFTFPEVPPPGLTLLASNLVDDGAIFHLNGVEVGRLRMPTGPVTRTDFALAGPWATNFDVLALPTEHLAHGDNVLAVEVHAASDTPPAVTFGMSLHAVIRPPLRIVSQPESQLANLDSEVSFIVVASGDPPPTYQWFFNETNPLPSGTASTLTLTNVQDTDAGFYSVVVDNGVAVTSSNALLTVNHPPVPASPVLERFAGRGVKCRVTELIGNDPDGDPLTLLDVGPATTQGGDVTVSGDWVFYTPPPGNTDSDSFTFSVRDEHGAVASGTAAVILKHDAAVALNIRAETLGDGSVRLRCDGIPGLTYAIEVSEILEPPGWQTLSEQVADPAGGFEDVDFPPPGSPARFYRAVQR